MTGMRQGDLLALRWCDVDWTAHRICVRRNLVRGEFGTPKSKRGSRSVPLADRLGGEPDRLYRQTAYQADDDLVFANPTGRPMNGNAPLKAFRRALDAAGVRRVRLHDLRHLWHADGGRRRADAHASAKRTH
jgi:integrase